MGEAGPATYRHEARFSVRAHGEAHLAAHHAHHPTAQDDIGAAAELPALGADAVAHQDN
jgi:hypothetical protein